MYYSGGFVLMFFTSNIYILLEKPKCGVKIFKILNQIEPGLKKLVTLNC